MNSFSYTALGAGFIALTVISYALVYRELKFAIDRTAWDEKHKRGVINRFLIGVVGWSIFMLGVSATGFFADFSYFPPRIMIVLSVPLLVTILVVFSRTMKELLPLIPPQNIIRLQVFRVFVELLLWAAFVQDLLPVQMSFEGRNFDVFSGILAPIVAYYMAGNRKILYAYNFISLGLLLNILVIAVLSLPTPLRFFMNDPANTLVANFPFVLLPGLLVPLAYGLAFLSLRQLSLSRKQIQVG